MHGTNAPAFRKQRELRALLANVAALIAGFAT
jgi:hypothetical protein